MDRDPWIHIPLGWGHIRAKRLCDWMYDAEPEASIGGRAVSCNRGRVIGGSSSINAMAYVRGNAGDYDRRAAGGLPTWSYENVLPYSRRQETWAGGTNAFRGDDGPLTTQYGGYKDPLIAAYRQGAIEAGHDETEDFSGTKQESIGRSQVTIRPGRRCSAAVA